MPNGKHYSRVFDGEGFQDDKWPTTTTEAVDMYVSSLGLPQFNPTHI